MWDVDGNGLSYIEDSQLASAILEKVNAMNTSVGLKCIAAATIFAALPSSSSTALAMVSVVLTALYFGGKVKDSSA